MPRYEGGMAQPALSNLTRPTDQGAAHRTFLDVERSLTGRRWAERLDGAAAKTATAIAQRHELPDLVARVLAGRHVSADEAPSFLSPSLKDLMPDPSVLTDMDAAAARIADAVTAGEAVAIFGDYDVDGASSSALLARFLRGQGLDPTIYIPDRIFEGYGPNVEAIKSLAAGGARLLVTVDCGTTSFEAIEAARGLGLDVVVIDHHLAGVDLPAASALVNPNRQDDLSGLGHLAAVGVTFMAIVAVNRVLRARGHYGSGSQPDLLQWLDLVALGTVCDVVPLIGLNRAFVSKGLLALARRANPGLAALADVSRLGGQPAPYHLGFMLGPRINAGGRIGDAGLGARLLVSDDALECERIAAELDRLNQERQAIETAMLEQATAEAEAEIGGGEGPAVLVTASNEWHPGVVGILASRLKDRFRRPAVAIAFMANGVGTGSGRSVPGVDLGRAVRGALERGIIVKGGGHVMAAGLTIEQARLGEFRAFMEDTLGAVGARCPRGRHHFDRRRPQRPRRDDRSHRSDRPGRPLWRRPSGADLRLPGAPHRLCRPRRQRPCARLAGGARRSDGQGHRLPCRRRAARPRPARGARAPATCGGRPFDRSLAGAASAQSQNSRRGRADALKLRSRRGERRAPASRGILPPARAHPPRPSDC